MRQLWLLFLVSLVLIELSVAQKSCGTKKKCRKLGINAGGVASCQAKEDGCEGKLVTGRKYCKDHKSCACCVPPMDCSKGTLVSCEALNGTCIGQDDICDGRVVTGETFCKSTDSCKCCFPRDTPACGCADGFSLYGKYCFHNTYNTFKPLNFTDFEAYCEDLGASLAYPINDLQSWLAAAVEALGGKSTWTSASKHDDGEWYWLDGSPVQPEAWEEWYPTFYPNDCTFIRGTTSLLITTECTLRAYGLCQAPMTAT